MGKRYPTIRTGKSMAKKGNVRPENVNESTEYPPPIDSPRRRLLSRITMNAPMPCEASTKNSPLTSSMETLPLSGTPTYLNSSVSISKHSTKKMTVYGASLPARAADVWPPEAASHSEAVPFLSSTPIVKTAVSKAKSISISGRKLGSR